jgi:hypothetical protein
VVKIQLDYEIHGNKAPAGTDYQPSDEVESLPGFLAAMNLLVGYVFTRPKEVYSSFVTRLVYTHALDSAGL